MTVRSLTPPVNATGLFEILTPYSLQSGLVYVCEEVRSFDELTRIGKKVFELYYEPVGLTRSDYERDVSVDAAIVTLKAGGDLPVYIPSTYILNYPGYESRGYENKIIMLEVGLLPVEFDISTLKTELADHTKSSLGVDASVYEGYHFYEGDLTAQQQADMEAARRLAQTNYKSKDQSIAELEAQTDLLLEQNKLLSETIVNLTEEDEVDPTPDPDPGT